DAIVVVENVERNIAAGLSPRAAAVRSMDEVGAALVAIALVLCAVFIPSAFITGISGQFYRQFAVTIAGATVISLIVSLTLSPALCALLLKPHGQAHRVRWWERPIRGSFRLFNRGFTAATNSYGWLAGRVVRIAGVMAVVYLPIVGGGGFHFFPAPPRLISPPGPPHLLRACHLPPGASLARTEQVVRRMVDIALATPGVNHVINIIGFSGATFTPAPNAAAMFIVLDPFTKRAGNPSQSADAIQRALFGKFAP